MFDDISYDKGGAVLRMLRAYLNRDTDPKPLLRRSLLQVPWHFPTIHKLESNMRFCNKAEGAVWHGTS